MVAAPPSAEAWAQVVKHRSLCRSAARRVCSRREDMDDLAQEGLFAILRALELYDPARGASLARFAWRRIRWRHQKIRHNLTMPLHVPFLARDQVSRAEARSHEDREGREETRGIILQDEGDTPEEQTVREERAARVLAALATLPDRDRQLVTLVFGLEDGTERSAEDAGALVGLGRAQAGHVLRRALAALRELPW